MDLQRPIYPQRVRKKSVVPCFVFRFSFFFVFRSYRVPLGPVRPQEVSGSLIPAPSPEGVGTNLQRMKRRGLGSERLDLERS